MCFVVSVVFRLNEHPINANFGYGGSAAVSHIQDECMAHEEDMLTFEYDSGWGGQDEDDDDFAEDGGFF